VHVFNNSPYAYQVIRSLTEKLNEQKTVLEEFKKKGNDVQKLEAVVESLHQELADSVSV